MPSFFAFCLSLLALLQGGILPGPGLPVVSSGATPTFVSGQTCVAGNGGTGQSTLTCNFPSNITSGHRVIIFGDGYMATQTLTPSDGPGDTFSLPTNCSVIWQSGAALSEMWISNPSAGGSDSVTITYSGTGSPTTFSDMGGVEITGSVGGPDVCNNNFTNTPSATPLSVSITTTANSEYCGIFTMVTGGSVTLTANTGYTSRANTSGTSPGSGNPQMYSDSSTACSTLGSNSGTYGISGTAGSQQVIMFGVKQ